MSGLLASAKPRRIKAAHRRRWKAAWGPIVQRYYDPGIGRFLSVDPVTADGNTGSNFNRYWYANNNPYRFTDPDGRLARNKYALGLLHMPGSCQQANACLGDGGKSTPESKSTALRQAKSGVDAADVALTAQGIVGPKKVGSFVSGDFATSTWKGATLKQVRFSRTISALGRKVSFISIGFNAHDFTSAYQANDAGGMQESGAGVLFGVGGFTGVGAPGALSYGGMSLLLENDTIYEAVITNTLDAHETAVSGSVNVACALTGKC